MFRARARSSMLTGCASRCWKRINVRCCACARGGWRLVQHPLLTPPRLRVRPRPREFLAKDSRPLCRRGDSLANEIDDRLRGCAGQKNFGDTGLLQAGNVGVRNDAADDDGHIGHPFFAQQLHEARAQRVVSARQNRKADDVDVLLRGSRRDHLRRLTQPRVNHFHTSVTQRARNHFRAAVMAVKPRLRNQHAYLFFRHWPFKFSAPPALVPRADSVPAVGRSARWYSAETEYAENAPTTLPLFQPAKKSIEDRVELFGIIDEQGVPGAFEDFELRSGNLLLHLSHAIEIGAFRRAHKRRPVDLRQDAAVVRREGTDE